MQENNFGKIVSEVYPTLNMKIPPIKVNNPANMFTKGLLNK